MKAVSIDKTGVTGECYSNLKLLDQWAKYSVIKWLKNISTGYLILQDGDDQYTFGNPCSQLRARVVVNHTITYRDILFNGLVGAGEAYMRGAWQSNDIVSVVRIICADMNKMSQTNSFFSGINQKLAGLVHRYWRDNSKANSRLNIAAHYDLGNDFFRLFLDTSMMYSSAIFTDNTPTLESAAIYKLEHVCRRLQLSEEDHLLEIGTGWGGMAIYAAKHYGCSVTTTTISQEQYDYAVHQVKLMGLENKVNVLLKDYRELEGEFDKLVSIEMIEAVGHQYYQEYFETCSRLLKPDGLMLIQAITVPDQRYEVSKYTPDFIQRYIFPGGELPCLSVIAQHVSQNTDMQLIGLEDITLDYAKTLSAWRQRFLDQLDVIRLQGFDEIFIRMWDFYLSYCEGGFRERTISTVQVMMAKPRCLSLPSVTALN